MHNSTDKIELEILGGKYWTIHKCFVFCGMHVVNELKENRKINESMNYVFENLPMHEIFSYLTFH